MIPSYTSSPCLTLYIKPILYLSSGSFNKTSVNGVTLKTFASFTHSMIAWSFSLKIKLIKKFFLNRKDKITNNQIID